MELLSIGAFARAARLSPERARVVAWLRRLGMPLARIRQVADLPSTEAADAVAGRWTAPAGGGRICPCTTPGPATGTSCAPTA